MIGDGGLKVDKRLVQMSGDGRGGVLNEQV